jgi:hypothetical protein
VTGDQKGGVWWAGGDYGTTTISQVDAPNLIARNLSLLGCQIRRLPQFIIQHGVAVNHPCGDSADNTRASKIPVLA